MTNFGIAYGLIGVATIAACAYMACHGCAWWQVFGMAALGVTMLPEYTRRSIQKEPKSAATSSESTESLRLP